MAKKRRKLYGAALKAHLRKVGGRKHRRRSRKNPHTVRGHVRRVKGRRILVRRHRSNPMAGFRIPTAKGFMGTAQEALWGILALTAGLYVSGFVSKQGERFMPAMVPTWVTKIIAAGLTVGGASYFVKSADMRKAVLYGAALPIVGELSMRFLPGVAGQVPMLAAAAMPSMPMLPGPAQASTVGAELEAELRAELQQESEDSLY